MTSKDIENVLADVLSYVTSGDIEIYHKYVSKMRKGQLILDVGTGYGKSAMAMGLSNKDIRIVSIDDGSMPLSNNYSFDLDSYVPTLERSFKNKGVKNIAIMVGDLDELSDLFDREMFDMVHIDMMDHVEEKALRLYLPKLKKDGILLLRNYRRKQKEFDKILENYPNKRMVEYGGLIQVIKL